MAQVSPELPIKKGSRAFPLKVGLGDLVRYQGPEEDGEGYIIGYLADCPDVAMVADQGTVGIPVNLYRITQNFGRNLGEAYKLRCLYERRKAEYPLEPLPQIEEEDDHANEQATTKV